MLTSTESKPVGKGLRKKEILTALKDCEAYLQQVKCISSWFMPYLNSFTSSVLLIKVKYQQWRKKVLGLKHGPTIKKHLSVPSYVLVCMFIFMSVCPWSYTPWFYVCKIFFSLCLYCCSYLYQYFMKIYKDLYKCTCICTNWHQCLCPFICVCMYKSFK